MNIEKLLELETCMRIVMYALSSSKKYFIKRIKESIKREEKERKKIQSLKGKIFRVQRGRKVLRTYKIIDICGRQQVLFRERIFTRDGGVKEHTRVVYQRLQILENKLGRKVI